MSGDPEYHDLSNHHHDPAVGTFSSSSSSPPDDYDLHQHDDHNPVYPQNQNKRRNQEDYNSIFVPFVWIIQNPQFWLLFFPWIILTDVSFQLVSSYPPLLFWTSFNPSFFESESVL